MTLLDVIGGHASASLDRRALRFLNNGEREADALSFGELQQAIDTAATHVLERVRRGDRVLLAYPPGLDFLVSLLGCMRAGVVAVPVSAQGRQRAAPLLDAIARDCGATAILSTAGFITTDHVATCATLAALPVIPTDAWRAPTAIPAPAPPPSPDSIALLQYTSGSTANPRGVVIRQRNLTANLREVQAAFGHGDDTVVVSWLPMFHDMGLGTVLQALWLGRPAVLMTPTAFLQQPVRWLRAISRYGGTTSGGPDFAYELCTRKVAAADRADLDLSSWRVAFSGAEPVRALTLERFAHAFAACGFRREMFHPVYGLAEATLLVTAADPRRPPLVHTVSAQALARRQVAPAVDDAVALVSCGGPWLDAHIAIVDPESGAVLGDGRVGELWVTGPSVADGYWQKDDGTFGARVTPDDGRRYLRTGDLAFRRSGETFITGRLKDLIIVRGRNHYPQDIEDTVCGADPAVRPGGAAAFPIAHDGGERLVVAAEIERRDIRGTRLPAVIDAIRRHVASVHGVEVHDVLLVSPGRLPRTTSGKLRRRACQAAYRADRESALDRLPVRHSPAHVPAENGDTLAAWLRDYASRRINSQVIDERRTIPPYVVLDFGSRGLLGMRAARVHGGLALPHADCARVLEQLGAIDLTLSLFVGLNNYLGIAPIERHGSDALKRALLPPLAAGRELAAFALTEAGAGSNPRAISTKAEPDGNGGWRLHGEKIWIGAAAWAGVLIVFARHAASDPRHPGALTAFIVRQGASGLSQGAEALTMGMRGLVQNSVRLDGVSVGPADVLGQPGDGMTVAHDAMMHARLAVAAACLGAMRRALQLAHRYASRRTVATGRLLDHPLTRLRLSDAAHATTAVAALVARVSVALDRGTPVPAELFAACKALAPELLWDVADGLMQLLGGRGYIETNVAPQMLRDARVLRIFEGPTETMHAFIGARIEADPAPMRNALRDVLGASAATALLDADARNGPRAGDPLLAQARRGRLAAAVVLLAAAAGTEAEEWARARFAAEASDLRLTVDPFSAAAVSAMLRRGVDAIGASDQAMPPATYERDPLLRDAVTSATVPPAAAPAPAAASRHPPRRAADIAAWLVARLEQKSGATRIDPARPLAEHGLDSLGIVELTHELSEWLAVPIEETVGWDYPTIDALAAALAERTAAAPAAGAAPDAPSSLADRLSRLEALLREDA